MTSVWAFETFERRLESTWSGHLRAGDVGHRPRPESIAVFNRARAGWQKAVYAINDALGDASGEALAIMLRRRGRR